VLSGQFDLPPGFEHWLLKFDGVGDDGILGVTRGFGRIEYAHYLMAVECGISMSECALLEVGGRRITRADLLLVATQFDIEGANRLLDQVAEVLRRWPRYARAVGVPDGEITRIAGLQEIS